MANQMAAPELDEVTGTTIGSQAHVTATELMKGGASKAEVMERLKDLLPKTTRTGRDNPIPQKVHTMVSQLLKRGFTVESSWKLVPPGESTQNGRGKAKGSSTRARATKSPSKGAGKKATARSPRKAASKAKPSEVKRTRRSRTLQVV